jgi:hypothetical protein
MAVDDPKPSGSTIPHVKPVYRVSEFCAEFGTGRSLAYEEIKAGRLRTFKVRSSTCIAGEDAMAWRELYRGRSD